MVTALSYVISVILTIILALILYPIAAIFWVFGLIGRLSEHTFKLTQKTIAYLWRDLNNSTKAIENVPTDTIES